MQASHARQTRTGKTQTHRVAGVVLIAGETVVGAAEGVVGLDFLRSTNRARLACGACHREPASAGQPAPARTLRALRRTRGQRDGFVRRTVTDHLPAARMRSRRGATRGDTHEDREVADGLEPALHLTTGWTRKAQATQQRGAVLVSPTQIAPATRRASEWGRGSSTRGRRQGARCRALAQHMQTRRARCRVWRGTRTFPRVVFYFGGVCSPSNKPAGFGFTTRKL